MKKFVAILFLASPLMQAGVVKFAAKQSYHVAKLGVKAAKKTAKVAYKVVI